MNATKPDEIELHFYRKGEEDTCFDFAGIVCPHIGEHVDLVVDETESKNIIGTVISVRHRLSYINDEGRHQAYVELEVEEG
jgi:hypothetical protein